MSNLRHLRLVPATPAAIGPQPGVIEALEDALRLARAGKLVSIALAAVTVDGDVHVAADSGRIGSVTLTGSVHCLLRDIDRKLDEQ